MVLSGTSKGTVALEVERLLDAFNSDGSEVEEGLHELMLGAIANLQRPQRVELGVSVRDPVAALSGWSRGSSFEIALEHRAKSSFVGMYVLMFENPDSVSLSERRDLRTLFSPIASRRFLVSPPDYHWETPQDALFA